MARRSKEVTPADDFEPDAWVIRSCGKDGSSYNGFRWPLEVGAIVTCPDWLPMPECGNGLHGLIDGIGDWSLIDADRVWQIVGVLRAEVVPIDELKVKFPRGKIAYVGTAAGAVAWIQPKMVEAILRSAKGNTATGDRGHAAVTGDYRHAAATGYSSHAAATGDRGHAAATGRGGHAAATGDSGHAAATGRGGHAAATGRGGHAAVTGDRGHAAATGDYGHAAATGTCGHAAVTGDRGHAAATGYRSHAAATGKHAIAASLGAAGTAKAGVDGWIVLAAWDDDWNLIVVKAAKVGGPEGIKPDVSYRLTVDGEFVEAV